MPKATIIIPAYNAAAFIEETLASIVRQTYRDFECIVIDDGSTDSTLTCVNKFADSRFRIISLSNSGGPAIPRNTGLNAAKGEYIFIFDSDDIMHPEKLEKSIAALDAHPEVGWLFTNFQSIDESGNMLKAEFLKEYDTLWDIIDVSNKVSVIPANILFNALISINFIGTSSVVLRRSALNESNRFDEALKNSDDRLFWVNFAKTQPAIFINETLHQYRIQGNAISLRSFDRRAPSKICAMLKMRELCETSAQRRSMDKQLHENYLAFANALRREKKPGSLKALKNSLCFGVSYRWCRGLIALLAASLGFSK